MLGIIFIIYFLILGIFNYNHSSEIVRMLYFVVSGLFYIGFEIWKGYSKQ